MEKLFVKSLKVIQSCRTPEQLSTARNYLKRAKNCLTKKENMELYFEYSFICFHLGIRPESI